jgi:PilZ domain
MALTLPVQVRASESDGSDWEEMTSTDDASFGGASFSLKHPLVAGRMVQLSLPLPKRFRRHDLGEPSYRVYGLVRDVVATRGGAVRVGVMFLGKHPPKDYEQNPGGHYLLPSDPPPAPKERRQFTRIENAFVNVRLQRVGMEGGASEERTVAENLGRGGARVMTSLPLAKGEIVMLEELGGPFRTRAEICNVYIGEDRIPRLNLHFLDAEAPDRLVQAR